MNKYKNTYINPTPLPDYPIGRFSLNKDLNWRETADPSVLYEDGRWYLYSSCGMVYYSDDFCTWKHQRMEPYDCGYAPTVVKHKGKYYLCGSLSDLYVSESPFGPFESIGRFTLPDGAPLERCYDPMLFSDDDGRLYLYYSTGLPEVLGAELDGDSPCRLLADPILLIKYDPSHIWERNGENNEDKELCSLEGPWMFKRNGIYYLIYCAPGTEYSTYAMGAYKGTGALCGFEYMKTNPFTSKKWGVVRGPGHGCVAEGPNNTLWAFYTCTMCYMDPMERRIGYDPIYINEDGDLVCPEITENPRWAPGATDDPISNGDTGLLCVTGRRRCYATSCASGRDAIYATDEDLMSWWQPADDDREPSLTIQMAPLGVLCSAVRLIWRDVGLSVKNGVSAGPFRYKLELRDTVASEEWTVVLDRADSTEDMVVDYRTFDSIKANQARLTIYGSPCGVTPGLVNISIFGE